jgi:outer membrane protein TolC
MDQVAGEVAEVHTQVLARKRQLETAEQGVRSATASYQRNLARIRDAQGLPLEVLQSLQALDQSRRQYLRVIAGYNEAQFRLQRALGWAICDGN